MRAPGPAIERLTRRLASCPPEFLATPEIGGRGEIRVGAVVSDLLRELGGRPLPAPGTAPWREEGGPGQRNRLRVTLIAAWLLHDEWFQARGDLAEPARAFLERGLDPLAALVEAERFVTDQDRREELARRALRALGILPAGESEAESEDRLSTLDSAERRRVLEASRAAERRARQVREAMQRKAAEEAAARITRE